MFQQREVRLSFRIARFSATHQVGRHRFFGALKRHQLLGTESRNSTGILESHHCGGVIIGANGRDCYLDKLVRRGEDPLQLKRFRGWIWPFTASREYERAEDQKGHYGVSDHLSILGSTRGCSGLDQ